MTQPKVHSAAAVGANARAAMQVAVTGAKRRKVLVLIAAYIDAGRCDPSVSELAKRAALPRPAVVAIVDQLERDGVLKVERAPGERNRYRLSVGDRDGR